jgi:hypothetical protein
LVTVNPEITAPPFQSPEVRTALYRRYAAAPSHVINGLTSPRPTAKIEKDRIGTATNGATSAVPRPEPFITAGPRSTPGTKRVSPEANAAMTTAADETQ